MSINMDTTEMIDYSDYRYQHMSFILNVDNNKDGAARQAYAVIDVDPLEDVAGLDVNEVAELVAFDINATIEIEAESGPQTASSSTELRGIFGLNLAEDQSQFIQEGANRAGEAVVFDPGPDGSAEAGAAGHSVTDDAILDQWRVEGAPSFDGIQDGTGGAASQPLYTNYKNYRNRTGRGPVVDSTDTVSCGLRLVTGDSVVQEGGRVRVSAIWDIMENDDAGRRFAVPE